MTILIPTNSNDIEVLIIQTLSTNKTTIIHITQHWRTNQRIQQIPPEAVAMCLRQPFPRCVAFAAALAVSMGGKLRSWRCGSGKAPQL